MGRVFLSHSSVDKDRFVRPLADALRRRGVNVWLDEAEVRPGDDLVQRIFDEGIGQSDAVAVILSAASLKSRWVQQELNASVVRRLTHDTRLIPIILDGVEPPVSLTHVVHIRTNDAEADAVAQQVADVVLGISAPPSVGQELPINRYEPRITGLQKIDELILRVVCDDVLGGNGYPYVARESLIAFADVNGISEDRLEESLSALAHAYYIEESHELGSRLPYAVKPTRYGFTVYLHSYYPNLDQATKDVAAAILNDGHFNDSQIAAAKDLPLSLVDYILETFENDGHVVLSRALDGVYLRQMPTLRRVLE